MRVRADPSRFDAWIRSLRAAPSRRAVLGATLAAALAPVDRDKAGARKKRKKCKACGPCKRCEKGRCKPKPDGTACGTRKVCVGGSCQDVPPTCADGIQNGDESAVDCGGGSCRLCTFAERCSRDDDCEALACVDDGQGGQRCAACAADADCADPVARFCDRLCGQIVPECVQFCVQCRRDGDCPANRPHCSPLRLCRGCLTDAHCTDPDFPACVDGECLECHTNADCAGHPDGPRCQDGFCRRCREDGDCPPNHACQEMPSGTTRCVPCGEAQGACCGEGELFLECPGAEARCYAAGSHCCNPATQPVCHPPSTCNGTRCCDPGQTSCDQGQCC